MLNGRDRHWSADGPLVWRAGLHWGVGGGGAAAPAWPGGISPMITSTKSTHKSVPLKHSVAIGYSTFMLHIDLV